MILRRFEILQFYVKLGHADPSLYQALVGIQDFWALKF